MNNLLVGDEGCSFSKVVIAMCKGIGKSILFQSWPTLALHLGTPKSDVDKLRQNLLWNMKDIAEVMSDLLSEWRLRNGSKATMSVLLDILEDGCEWKATADALYEEFKMEIGENTRWTDLHKRTQNEILEGEVIFLGSTTALQSVLNKLTLNESQRLQIQNSFRGSLIRKMLTPGKMSLTREILPGLPQVYIPRTLSTRRKIDPKIFQAECPDIFVVENISLIKLSAYSGKHRVDHSYRQAEDLTVRFISLDSVDHFEDICEQAKLNSVHLINYKDENFYWVKTHGNLHQIQAQLHDDPEFIPEGDFPNHLGDSQDGFPICIADNPGMGKTLLLANLCQRRRSQNPEKYMIYANFGEIFGIKFNNTIPEYKSTDITWHNVVDHLAENELGRKILTQVYMTEPHNIELYLDGFDEIPTAKLHLAINHLKSFATSLKGVQVFTTTRVHRQVELERALGTLSFNILPFSQSDQINFFRETWNREYSIPKNSNLEKFASFLVAEVRSKFSSKENDITGVPLQCSMLAEIYHKSAKRNARQSKKHCDISLRINSLHEMYEKLLKRRFQRIEADTTRKGVLHVHQMAALELLLPAAFLKYSGKLIASGSTPSIMKEEVNSVGILLFVGDSNRAKSTIRFFHRTYAEFILADWLITSFHHLNSIMGPCIALSTEQNDVFIPVWIRNNVLIGILLEILDVKKMDGGIKAGTQGCGANDIWMKLVSCKNIEKCRQEWVRVARALNLCRQDIARIHSRFKLQSERQEIPNQWCDILWLMLLQWVDDGKKEPLLAELVDALDSCGFDDLAGALESRFYSNSFHNYTLCFFLNTFLEHSEITVNIILSSGDIFPQIASIVEACTSHHFSHLFRLISRCCKILRRNPAFQIFCKTRHWPLLLVKMIAKSNASLLEECCTFVEEMEGKPLHQLESGSECFGVWEYKPLHVACHRGDLSSFLFLSKKYEGHVFGMKGLLHFCTTDSLNDSEEVINARMEMIDYLLKINPAFLDERDPFGNRTPLLMTKVHLRLLEFLLEKGANARSVDDDRYTLVRQAARHFSPEDFHRLIELLIEKGCGDVFLIRDWSGDIQLAYRFEFAKIKVETVELIAAHVTKGFNISGSEGTTILCSAVRGLQKMEILVALVNYGADPKRVENDVKTMVHLAALSGHVEAIGYLCSLGCDVNARDFHQRTALHTVVTMGTRNLDEVVMALLVQRIDVNAFDDEGRSALWYAEKMEDFRKLNPGTLKALQDAAEENPAKTV